MPDYRFIGIANTGKSVQGVIAADTTAEAKKKIKKMAAHHKVKISKIQKRKTWIYKIQKNGEKPVKGEQKAFTKQEVNQALTKLGYKVLSVQPKMGFLALKPPAADLVTFVRLSADLLREKLPFNEVLQLLSNDLNNPALRDAVRQINNDLRQGKDSEEAFLKQERVLGKFTARMLGLASKSGNMADIYESTAKFLERNAEFRKNMRQALIMPLFTLLILFGACVFYVAYIFPETAKLFLKLGSELPPMTKATLDLSDFLIANMPIFSIVMLVLSGGIIYFLRTPQGRFFKDRYILKLPIMGPIVHKTTIEIFCRVFYSLYSGSGENVDAIRLASEACGNKYFEDRIKNVSIPLMLREGRGLVDSFKEADVFTPTALSRFNSGAETGTVKMTAVQIANYYEKETVYKLKNAVDLVQIVVAMIIMIVMTALTLVSSETALVSPKSPVG
ncbi:MAG: type II secretion system F family protein [bacterium]|nr:MAG: type II secretion system F family protein [bacterium]